MIFRCRHMLNPCFFTYIARFIVNQCGSSCFINILRDYTPTIIKTLCNSESSFKRNNIMFSTNTISPELRKMPWHTTSTEVSMVRTSKYLSKYRRKPGTYVFGKYCQISVGVRGKLSHHIKQRVDKLPIKSMPIATFQVH